MRLRGSTGTDARRRFVADGLEGKFEALHTATVNLSADFSRMDCLLQSAMAERFLYFRKPEIPVQSYRRSTRCDLKPGLCVMLAACLHACPQCCCWLAVTAIMAFLGYTVLLPGALDRRHMGHMIP